MKRKLAVIAAVILVILAFFLYYRYAQQILVWRVNPQINAGGIKLMMAESKARSILGTEEEYIQGFGGYYLGYKSKGISLTFLSDSDTDFYKKVNKIEVTDTQYSIFDTRVGQDYDEALLLLKANGITGEREGFPGFWKSNLNVILDKDSSGIITKITVGIADRVASKRVY